MSGNPPIEESIRNESHPVYLQFIRKFTAAAFPLILCALVASAWAGPSTGQEDRGKARIRPSKQQRISEAHSRRARENSSQAKRRGIPVEGKLPGGGEFELSGFEKDGRPRYFSTLIANQSITSRTDLVRLRPEYGLPSGKGMTIGMWDSGLPRPTHEQLRGRITSPDGTTYTTAHSTLVAGVLAASATATKPNGMAPAAMVASYSYGGDLNNMELAARRASSQAGKLLVSNHSYQRAGLGWALMVWDGLVQPFWQGPWGTTVDPRFGSYSSDSRRIDTITYEAPYYLPVWSAGNDRSTTTNINAAPLVGQRFYYFDPVTSNLAAAVYDPAIHPAADHLYAGGYDTMIPDALAKNALAVGSVQDAVTNGSRNLALATTSYFSSWGPADDGRVKPDLVANGATVSGPYHTSDTSSQSGSGTSFSAPSVAGSALLLQEMYAKQSGGTYMRSATLKALMIHTAEELGAPGPDYIYGWGLLDMKRAADQVMAYGASPSDGAAILETSLTNGGEESYLPVIVSSGGLRVTLAWTDPPGPVSAVHNERVPRLINDLDLRVSGPSGAFLPFILDPERPSAAATVGDNVVDNVEQVRAIGLMPGSYVVTVGHKGILQGGTQGYSLIVSGHESPSLAITPDELPAYRNAAGSFAGESPLQMLTLTNRRAASTRWEATSSQSWATLVPDSGTLADMGDAVSATVLLDEAAINLLPAGCHAASIIITDLDRGTEYVRTVVLEAEGPQELPASQGFEGGSFDFAWRPNAVAPGVAKIDVLNDAPAGAHALLMFDTDNDGIPAEVSVDWTVSTGATGDRLWLTYMARAGANEEFQAPPEAEPYAYQAFDGLAFSADGENWYTLTTHSNLWDMWSPFSVDLTAALKSKGLAADGAITLRFGWTGDGSGSAQGFCLDEVAIEDLPMPTDLNGIFYDVGSSQYYGFALTGEAAPWPIGPAGATPSRQLDHLPMPGGRFLSFSESTGDILSIDSKDGSCSQFASAAIPFGNTFNGATWEHTSGRLFTLSTGAMGAELRENSPANASASPMTMLYDRFTMKGLATYGPDHFYSIDTATMELYLIQPSLYRGLPVGFLGVTLQPESVALSMDDTNGTLYLMGRLVGETATGIWRVDRKTGAARQELTLPGEWVATTFALDPPATECHPWVFSPDVTVVEGHEGEVSAQIVLTLSSPSAVSTTIAYKLESLSATVLFDAPAQEGTVTIPAGAVSATIAIAIKGDLLHEGNETLVVELTVLCGPAELAQHRAIITIVDDDKLPKYAGQSIDCLGSLGTVELQKPAVSLVPVAPISGVAFAGGDNRGDDTSVLYAWDTANNRLLAVNTSDGSYAVVGNATPLDGGKWSGLTWDGKDQRFYALSTNGVGSRVYKVALSPFSVTNLTPSNQSMCPKGAALASDPKTGRLWAVDRIWNRLVHFDKTTGECLAGASLSPNLVGIEATDADFLTQTGDLYLAQWNPARPGTELLLVDTATGITTFVGMLGSGSARQTVFATTPISVPVELSLFTLD